MVVNDVYDAIGVSSLVSCMSVVFLSFKALDMTDKQVTNAIVQRLLWSL